MDRKAALTGAFAVLGWTGLAFAVHDATRPQPAVAPLWISGMSIRKPSAPVPPIATTRALKGIAITITAPEQDAPEFERIYKSDLDGGFRVEIRIRTFLGSRMDSSILYQENGKYILFDAESVADKIIDRELYPRVQFAVDEMLRLDREFMASEPVQYTDENGTTWRRVHG
jgi:hypothetical protein